MSLWIYRNHRWGKRVTYFPRFSRLNLNKWWKVAFLWITWFELFVYVCNSLPFSPLFCKWEESFVSLWHPKGFLISVNLKRLINGELFTSSSFFFKKLALKYQLYYWKFFNFPSLQKKNYTQFWINLFFLAYICRIVKLNFE